MFYSITKEDGYIVGVAKGVSEGNANCTEEEYEKVRACLANRPTTAPDGCCYRLDEKLNWLLCEIPIVDIPMDDDEMATEEDYQEALSDLGVKFNA